MVGGSDYIALGGWLLVSSYEEKGDTGAWQHHGTHSVADTKAGAKFMLALIKERPNYETFNKVSG